MNRIHPSRLLASTVIGVPAEVGGGLLTVEHVGVVASLQDQQGLPFVYNASKRTGRIMLDSWAEFTQRREGRVLDVRGALDADEVLRRAHSRLGERWNLVFSNCEHYVRWCHDLDEESPQLQKGLVVAGGLVALGGLVIAAIATADEG
ncbi:lecithin retinol acyltransferase family protein [Candidatus Uhrbacteria bacterium]|nr:lecithin retinol acyltransferase family protein [Candidatus Uhrbacteria bacterium]